MIHEINVFKIVVVELNTMNDGQKLYFIIFIPIFFPVFVSYTAVLARSMDKEFQIEENTSDNLRKVKSFFILISSSCTRSDRVFENEIQTLYQTNNNGYKINKLQFLDLTYFFNIINILIVSELLKYQIIVTKLILN